MFVFIYLLILKGMEEEKVVIKMDRNLYFPSVERFRNALTKAAPVKSSISRTIILDMSRVTQIDHTSLNVRCRILF